MYTNKQSGFNLKKRYICECIIITTGTPSNVYKVFDYYFLNCNERRKIFWMHLQITMNMLVNTMRLDPGRTNRMVMTKNITIFLGHDLNEKLNDARDFFFKH